MLNLYWRRFLEYKYTETIMNGITYVLIAIAIWLSVSVTNRNDLNQTIPAFLVIALGYTSAALAMIVRQEKHERIRLEEEKKKKKDLENWRKSR